ncbi:MAG TPA: SH3 domain-containing protein [Candidatus Aquilonibacter sp.]|nr:SH3 domain-containing protein [Candidatus Aquilonibacter sp.]
MLLVPVMVLVASLPVHALHPWRSKDKEDYGMGLLVNIPLPESEVEKVVADVAQNGIIRGTKEYNKDQYVDGAISAASTDAFPRWTDGGKVFFKVRKEALDPRNFKDSNDVGTLAVRYVLQKQGEKNTILRIDAIFVEDFRRGVHLSNGSVESAEYKDIKGRLDAIEVMKTQTAEAEREQQEARAKKEQLNKALEVPREDSSSPPVTDATRVEVSDDTSLPAATPPQPAETLQQRVQDLRRQVERVVRAPGAPLKSAPFHTASTLQSLASGTQVVIMISTPYWYGVQTQDGQLGWIPRDELEQLP